VEQCSLSFENHTTNQFASGSTERQNEIWNDVIPKDHTSVRPPQQHGPLIITEKLDSSPNTTLASNKNGFTGLKHKHSRGPCDNLITTDNTGCIASCQKLNIALNAFTQQLIY